MPGLDQQRAHPFPDLLVAVFSGEGSRACGDESSGTPFRVQPSRGFQFAVGARDCVGIDQ